MAESIGRKLAELGTFQIVAAQIDGSFDMNQFTSGEFSERQLYDLSSQYRADGILFCETTEFSPYEPMGVGCSLTLFDTRELVVHFLQKEFGISKTLASNRNFCNIRAKDIDANRLRPKSICNLQTNFSIL